MKLIIDLIGKSLLLLKAIKQVLANAEKKKHISLNKNLYYFINKEKYKFIEKYDSVCFDYSYLNMKQNALKIYINTFYNTAKDNRSFFFLCELAESVTLAERRNIKLVIDFIKSKSF